MRGMPLCDIHARTREAAEQVRAEITQAYRFQPAPVVVPPLIIATIPERSLVIRVMRPA